MWWDGRKRRSDFRIPDVLSATNAVTLDRVKAMCYHHLWFGNLIFLLDYRVLKPNISDESWTPNPDMAVRVPVLAKP